MADGSFLPAELTDDNLFSTAAPVATHPLVAAFACENNLSDALPDYVDYSNPAAVEHILQLLMPGQYSTSSFKRLANKFKEYKPQCILTTEAEVASLLKTLRDPTILRDGIEVPFGEVYLWDSGIGFDPFSGTGTIARQALQAGYHIYTNDLNTAHAADQHDDATQPIFYKKLFQRNVANVFITSPWFPANDIVIPLMCAFAKYCVLVHVPGHYITSAPPPRRDWLNQLNKEGRLHIIFGLPRGPIGFSCAWLCIFRDQLTRDAYITPRPSMTW